MDAVATRFVLIEPSHPGNVGAAARAMKVMGFHDLVLVRPRWADVLQREETHDRASGADDVIADARVVGRVEDALDGVTHACATVMTPRDFGPPTRAPRAHFETLLARPDGALEAPASIAFLFGCERYGMTNEDVYRCHAALCIPSDVEYGSLNLAAAVQLIAYDWRMALARHLDGWNTRLPHALEGDPVADAASVASMLEHWERTLVAVGFLDPDVPKKLMPRLRQLCNRARPTQKEVNVLRGMARAIEVATRPGAVRTAAEPAAGLAANPRSNR